MADQGDLRTRAAESKRVASRLREELGLRECSTTLMVGVGADGGLRVIVTAPVDEAGARRIIAAALDSGVEP
jgi:hypothetical protein